ncbi:MAG: Aspartate aminotransferase [Gammaproteobacteria bacterium]|nr:Aspartate aminotransferase [Gammaproteobacteria bacterium]
MQPSLRAQSVKPSPTLAVSARANAMKAEGKDILSLAAGEPDFDTPDFIKDAAIRALKDGFTKYTAVDGTAGLKKAIIGKFERENGLTYKVDEILVSVGCKHSIYNLFQAVLNDGDEVIIPAPYWASYPDMVVLAGARPVIIDSDINDGFKITPIKLAAAITPKSKIFVINSPSNPTGISYSPAELKALGEVLEQHPQVLIASDDIYEHILWEGGGFKNIVNACPSLMDRTIVLNGVSKAYSMTGWRIGYAAGPKPVIAAMNKIQSQSTSNPTSIAQVAAQAALEGDQSFVREQCKIFKQRHDFCYERLNRMKGVICVKAQGTFYIFPDMNGAMKALGLKDDIDFAEWFLEKTGCAMVPGSAFGAAGCMRISFATSMDVLADAMNRMHNALGSK